ncbi:ATP-binding protein [Streptomyces sp. NPDC007988]|uniref:ATP-binding protein n=1 Tax=Streptomyces sp. NPDC007988 TaxID=3364802 RepID=UPI0036E42586
MERTIGIEHWHPAGARHPSGKPHLPAESGTELTSKLGSYLRPAVLVLDEVGYRPLAREEANLVFQVTRPA